MSRLYQVEEITPCIVKDAPVVKLGSDVLTSYLVGDKLYFYISHNKYHRTGNISISITTISGKVINITTKYSYTVSDLIRECVRLKGLINCNEVKLGEKEYIEYLSYKVNVGNLIIRNIGGTLI